MNSKAKTYPDNQWLVLAGFLALCLAVSGLAGFATSQSITTWYLTLQKPSWTPPGWLFGPVWTVLYLMMAVAAWRVWRKVGNKAGALILFYVQLALNFAWTFSFFAAQSPALGLLNIIALWLAIAACMVAFRNHDRVAMLLMLPYIAWVSFASALNFAIWLLNRAG